MRDYEQIAKEIKDLKGILGRLNTEDLSNSQRIEVLRSNIKMLENKIKSLNA